MWTSFLDIKGEEKKSCAVCGGRTASEFVETSVRIQRMCKRNTPKFHTESKLYIDFESEIYFDVEAKFILIWYSDTWKKDQ
jgi:hypothetical protein